MIEFLTEMFTFSFMQRALIVGVLIAIAAALIGVTIVLKRNSMIGDGLSHVAFSVFAIAAVAGFAPLYLAIPVVIIASFLITYLSQNKRLSGDAAIAALSASSLAIGTLVISMAQGVNIDINSYLFGSILAVSWTDLVVTAVFVFLVVVLFVAFYNRIFSVTFDTEFARATGVRAGAVNAVLSAACAVVVVLGMRLLGALLISSLIVFPVLTAKRLTRSFKGLVIAACVVSVAAFVVGLVLSYVLAAPTGAMVVVVNLAALTVAALAGRIFRK